MQSVRKPIKEITCQVHSTTIEVWCGIQLLCLNGVSCSLQVVRLVDLLDEAKSRCSATIRERREARNEPITDEELEHSSSVMGYGAVKYADLKNNRLSNYKFSFDEMLNLKGNTAVYLLYAYARICGIIRRSDKDLEDLKVNATLELKHEKELALGLHLARFPEVSAFPN